MTCAGDEQLGPCAGQSAGTVLRGIPSAVAQTDRFALLTPDEYTSVIGAWFADARPELSDEYGSGVPGLFALAYGPADRYGEDVYLAILTGIFTSQTADLRQARILSFQLLDGSWRLTQDMFVPGSLPAGGGADDFLSGECDFCYDHWERWEGTP